MDRAEDRITGLLLGTALGDALGLPAEGLRPRVIARRMMDLGRFRLLGRTGFTSDDTEMTVLVGHCLLRSADNVEGCVRAFRWAVRGFLLRLPFGIGLATLRSGMRLVLGLRRSGVNSAGNGAAMRAAVVGARLNNDATQRHAVSDALAKVTHTDARAVEAARFVAELAAWCVNAEPTGDRAEVARLALGCVHEPSLHQALERAVTLAAGPSSDEDAATQLGTTGFVVHSVPWALWVFVRHGANVLGALQACIRQGGDTDTHAAILGGWLGALHGATALPADLVAHLQGGPFGRAHLVALGHALAASAAGRPVTEPRWSAMLGLLRNLALYPVILAHGFRRLLPPY